MILYLLNKSQKAIKAFPSEKLVEAKYTEGINEASKLTFSVPLEGRLPNSAFFALFQKPDSSDFLLFKINDETIENDRISYTGVDAAYDELKSYSYVKDIRPVKRTAKEILQRVLQGTRWEVGYIDSTGTMDTNFYYQPCLECIQKIAQLFNMEVVFTYGFDSKYQVITSRKVNLYQQQGQRTGKRFEYGSNLLTVTREEDSQDIVTALVGRGKGEEKTDEETGEATGGYGRRINFSNVVWSKANGDPADKPAGQEYVEDVQATKIFGYDDGKPRIGIVIFEDIEDPVELLKATWASLKSSDRPKVTFKASVTDVGNLGLGDTIAIIRHELEIEYFTRVFKVTHDLLDKQNNTVEMGDDLSGNSLTSYISSVDSLAQSAQQQATNAAVQAGSKNKNFYSTTKPKIADEGDNLFLNLGNGNFEYWVWHNHQWEFIQSTQDLKNVEQNVKEAQQGLTQAEARIKQNHDSANRALTTINKTLTGLTAKVDDGVNKSEFEALSNQLNLKVSKGDVLSEINLEAGTSLIKSNKIYLDSDSVVFSGKAFIPDAAITNISADKITAGTLDAGKINVINMNADNIVAGTLSGKNVKMDLTSGDIRFSAGRFHNSDDTFDINIDDHYLYSENTKDVLDKNSLLIKNGELTLGKDTFLASKEDYLKLTRVSNLTWGNGITGSAIGTCSAIAGTQSIAIVQARDLNNIQVPFFDQTDKDNNQIQAYTNNDFVGLGVSQPYSESYLLDNIPTAIYISSGNDYATQIKGRRISINTYVKDNNDSFVPEIKVGTKFDDLGFTDKAGYDTYLQSKTFYFVFDDSENTIGASPNLCLDMTGRLCITTSASRFKTNIKRLSTDSYGNKLLNIPPAIWNDKSEMKRYKAIGITPKKYYGMIAEDLAKAGLELLISRNKNDEITGIQYDRIGVALIPVIRELKNKVQELEKKINEQSK